jgi:hypothetical protein
MKIIIIISENAKIKILSRQREKNCAVKVLSSEQDAQESDTTEA